MFHMIRLMNWQHTSGVAKKNLFYLNRNRYDLKGGW